MYYNNQNDAYENGYTPYEFTGENAAGQTAYSVPYQRKKTKRHGGLKTVALALSCSLLGGLAGAGLTGALNGAGSTTVYESGRAPATVEVAYKTNGEEMTAAEVYAANVNSTVGITTSIVSTNYFGFRTNAAASGSGFIISADGYIVTNYHVIEGASSIKVTTYNNESYDAVFVGGDESSDLAVLKIDANGLQPVTLGDSATANVGDDVVAIGNPLGELTFSLTKGSVSALNREITLSSGTTMNLIQTDAAINSGNSGGALFNLYGEVIGITNAKYSGSGSSEASIDNIGFAIPINSVKSIITSIIEKGVIVKPYIGVSLEESEDGGVTVRSVETASPAEEAGLQAGDVLRAVNGKTVSSAGDVSAAISEAGAGGSLQLTVERNDGAQDVTVTVGEKQSAAQTDTGAADADMQSEGASGRQAYGFPFDFFGGDMGRS